MTEFTITETGAEMRLDRFLRREVAGLTQGSIQKFLRAGKIRLNGARTEANARLTVGDTLSVPEITPPENMPRERHVMKMDPARIKELQQMILYQDDSVIVLNKPAGLAVQGGSGIAVHIDGMLDALRTDEQERPKLVHRLDRDTSGVLLLARTARAAQKLATAFRGRDVEKTYWALLAGVPDVLEGRIDLPLKRVELGGTSRSEPTNRKDPDAQKAITDYKVRDYAGKKFSWVELHPHTGRMHQLRAHCLALGTPILGDAAYGTMFSDNLAPQLHLHARAMKVPHPDGGYLFVEAPLSKHMQDGFTYLGFTAPEAQPSKRLR
jgi:23S rRNA pseudouridine955/2504/2580 synthase